MKTRRLLALLVPSALLLATIGCDDQLRLNGALEGLTGTTATNAVNEAFVARLAATPTGSGGLADTQFAGQAYDAVVTIALAAEAAGTDGIDLAGEIVGITADGTACFTFTDCRNIIRSGGDPAYAGVVGGKPLNAIGEPETASYEVRTMGPNDRIDPALTTYRSATPLEDPAALVPALEGTRTGNGTLDLGLLVPIGRPESIYQPAIQAGFELAIAEINSLGGVLGKQVTTMVLDAGSAADGSAVRNAQQLVDRGVDAIVGPATSAVAAAIIDTVTSAGVVLFSPSTTAAALTAVADRGLFFRNIPSDVLQGDTLARLIAERGNQTAFLIVRDDLYGVGFAEQLRASLPALRVKIVGEVVYPTDTESFSSITAQVKQADPDAVVLVSFEEASRLLRSLVVAGLGPRRKQVFGGDGTVSNTVGELFDAGK